MTALNWTLYGEETYPTALSARKPAVSPARSTTAASAVYLARREMRTRRSSRRSRLFGRRCMWFGIKITPIGQSGCFVLSIL